MLIDLQETSRSRGNLTLDKGNGMHTLLRDSDRRRSCRSGRGAGCVKLALHLANEWKQKQHFIYCKRQAKVKECLSSSSLEFLAVSAKPRKFTLNKL